MLFGFRFRGFLYSFWFRFFWKSKVFFGIRVRFECVVVVVVMVVCSVLGFFVGLAGFLWVF